MKKSLYVFMCSVLGVLLFLTLEHSLLFLLVIGATVWGWQLDYERILAFNVGVMMVTGFLGGWYGVWLGLHWYRGVYEDRLHSGLVNTLAERLFELMNKKQSQTLAKSFSQTQNVEWGDVARVRVKSVKSPRKSLVASKVGLKRTRKIVVHG